MSGGTVVIPDRSTGRPGRGARRFGYAIAIAVNLGMFYVVSNIVDWGWPAFVTPEFADVENLVLFSIGASIVANATYLSYDRRPFKSFAEMLLNAIAFGVTLRLFQVFPFDFTGYSFDWSTPTRIVLVLAMIGTAIGFLTELARGVRSATRGDRRGD
ncbi:MAG TPA: hypothetical protein VLB67_01015 [Acidimicrobiia bacterium]|nr:hypothetical protein [Acidimicrobiia bacterium]